MSSNAPLNNHDAKKQAGNNTHVSSFTDKTFLSAQQSVSCAAAEQHSNTGNVSQSTDIGFTSLEIEQICRILVRIAIRIQEHTDETIPEEGTETAGSTQSLGNPDTFPRRESRHIRQTIHLKSGKE